MKRRMFYDTDANVVCRGESDARYVRYDGWQADYYKMEEYLFNIVKEEGLPLSTLTIMDVSRAHNDEILEYIKEIGKQLW